MTRLVPELERTGPFQTLKDGDDFTEPVKKTLGDFLKSAVTDPDDGNIYLDDEAYATQDELARHDGTSHFKNLEASEYEKFNSIIDDVITSKITTAEILKAIKGTPGGSPFAIDSTAGNAKTIVDLTQRVLTVNRFSPDASYMEDGHNKTVMSTMPTSLGNYTTDGAPVRFEDLQKVGLSLMLRATGEFITGDPTKPGVSLGSLLPGQAQLGIKIDTVTMRAANVPGAPGADSSTRGMRSKIKDVFGENVGSYGQLNSYNEPFDGFLPLGMTGLAVIMTVALRLAATGLVRLIGLIAGKPFGPGAGKLSVDPLTFGQYGKQEPEPGGFIRLTDIGIIQLDRDWIACVDEGIRVFFDFDGTSFKRVARSPGYYANFVRTIIQSGGRIITDAVEAFKTLGSGNLVGGAQATLGIIDVLKTSKIVAFLNIMAILGDRSFALKDAGVDRSPRGSIIDGIPDGPVTRIMKSRSNDGGKLAWRTSASPSALILPKSVKSAAQVLNASPTDVARKYDSALKTLGKDAQGKNLVASWDVGRLSEKDVENVETALEAEYAPFYFHDLRTNEIVSFHAFFAGITEQYSPSYAESTPYGRVDPIMIYGSTKRTFNFSFHIVATSPEDFDIMYVKINKLSTLLYPQWTNGRTVQDADGRRFIQPFSQVPGASPMCRIRLGDLVKTNFTNVALARLFGLGNDDFLTPEPRDPTETPDAFIRAYDMLEKQINAIGYQPGQFARLNPTAFQNPNQRNDLLSIPGITPATGQDLLLAQQRTGGTGSTLDVKIKRPGVLQQNYRGGKVRVYVVTIDEPGFKDATYTIPGDLLEISQKEIAKLIPSLPAIPGAPNERADFFNKDSNAIVKSFNNVKGKGLAGFITTMTFNWDEASGRWEVGRYFARAPQLCKIDMQFTVIHDIAPGLDADGGNRAPIYPVGDAMLSYMGDTYVRNDNAGRTSFKQQWGQIRGKK